MSGFKDQLGGELFYPRSPGWRDPVTSRAAAVEIKDDAASLRALVLDQLRIAPSTVHQMAAKLDRAVSSVQPRFSELLAQGKIRWTGELERNAVSNKRAKIWEST